MGRDRDDRFIDPRIIEEFEADRTPYSKDPWQKQRTNLWGSKRFVSGTEQFGKKDWVWVRVKIPRDWNLYLDIQPALGGIEPFWQVEFGAANGSVLYALNSGVHTIFGDSVTIRTPDVLLTGLVKTTFVAFCGPANVSPSWTGTFIR
jgi:hypothetical protein